MQLRFEPAALDDVVDEAEALRLARVEDFARQQKLARPALAYEPGQQHRRHGRENSELYLRLPELRARGGDDDVAGRHEFEPAAQRRPVHDRERGLRQLLERAEDVVEGFQHPVDGLRLVLLDRDARAEGARAFPRVEDDGHHVAHAHAGGQRAVNLAHHRDREDVQRRVREGDARHAVFDAEAYVLVKLFCHEFGPGKVWV